MNLRQVEIEGFRSITQEVTLMVEPSITIIVGANDHGKTNLLEAVSFLNSDKTFDMERDLSWDRADDADKYPRIVYEFSLDDQERLMILESEREARRKKQGPGAQSTAGKPILASPETSSEPSGESEAAASPELQIELEAVPMALRLERCGVGGALHWLGFDQFDESVVSSFIKKNCPRVEIIPPSTKLEDKVTIQDLTERKNEFMRGIFYYAGLNPNDASTLFVQNDQTRMMLHKASQELNRTLKTSWTQGQELQFALNHHSKIDAIEMTILDPSVTSRWVRASRRSTGFTHFFMLKTILHARQQENRAKSYIWLFDEPGIHLHPSGQHDLLQVLDTLGKENQIIYATHSLFMINKTFPTRHRLIYKDKAGTTVEGKPYRGRWGGVVNALGLSLTGSILFANHVLLTEGDSDPIYMYAIFQTLISLGKLSADLNAFTAIGTGETRNADALIRLLRESQPSPKVVLLLDGDKGGKDRLGDLQKLLDKSQVQTHTLTGGTTIEDHLPGVGDLYVEAVARYVRNVLITRGDTVPELGDLQARIQSSFNEKYQADRVTLGVCKWAAEVAQEIGGLSGPPSKLGIAREYVNLLADADPSRLSAKALNRASGLAERIQQMLDIPRAEDAPQSITAD